MAGADDLLAPYLERARFGIEIDPDHAGGAFETSYAAIAADAQNVVPMLRFSERRHDHAFGKSSVGRPIWEF